MLSDNYKKVICIIIIIFTTQIVGCSKMSKQTDVSIPAVKNEIKDPSERELIKAKEKLEKSLQALRNTKTVSIIAEMQTTFSKMQADYDYIKKQLSVQPLENVQLENIKNDLELLAEEVNSVNKLYVDYLKLQKVAKQQITEVRAAQAELRTSFENLKSDKTKYTKKINETLLAADKEISNTGDRLKEYDQLARMLKGRAQATYNSLLTYFSSFKFNNN